LGVAGGEQAHAQTQNEMPSHNHSNANPFSNTGANVYINPTTSGTAGASDPTYLWHPTGFTGGGAAMNVLQPTIVINYIIKAF
jgi:microcystin-dependent protein